MANMTNKITRRSFGALALGSFGALALTACGSSNTSGSSSSASASATGKKVAPSALPSGMGTTTVDGEFPVPSSTSAVKPPSNPHPLRS